MTSKEKLIEVHNLTKTYTMGSTSIEVLKGVDCSLLEGEFVMMMGPSGSGKSTFLQILGGLDQATSGSVHVLGSDITQASDRWISSLRNQSLGFIFQFYHLFPELNAYENVYLPALLAYDKKLHSKEKYAQKADELFEMMGLENRKFHRPQEMSGGEQQRVAIARALMNDPKILLADEPTGNLDAAAGEVILNLLDQIQKLKKLAIVMVTHNSDFLKRAHRVLYLRNGKI